MPITRRTFAFGSAAVAAAAALSGCGSDSGSGRLRFLSLAWQEASVKANKDIVAAWNDANPDTRVEYVQGSWDSAGDDLLTSFEGNEPPDIIHYEAALAAQFAQQGYLADLTDLVPDDLRGEIGDPIWDTVTTPDGVVFGVPFLLESQVVIANRGMLDDAGIDVPDAGTPWSWDDFADHAKALTTKDRFGVAWPLKQPVNRILNLSLNFDGGYFTTSDGRSSVVFGDAEAEVPQRIHAMIHSDKSADPDAVGMGATDPLPGFFDGRFALLPGSIYLRQQMVEQAPDDFDWVTLPPLVGTSADQAANPNILAVAAQSEQPEAAMRFIAEFLKPDNMNRLAQGDWMIPTGSTAGKSLLDDTGGEDGWDIAVASADSLVMAPFQQVEAFSEWKTKIGTPAFQQYFAGEIDLDALGEQLVSGGDDVL